MRQFVRLLFTVFRQHAILGAGSPSLWGSYEPMVPKCLEDALSASAEKAKRKF